MNRNYVVLTMALLCISVAGAESEPQEYEGRLLTAIASYSDVGLPFRVRITGTMTGRGTSSLPPGTIVRGSVRSAHSIGLGFKRERARMQVGFDGCELPGGESVACDVRLLSVDNARETVQKENRIVGILAASHPHSWLSGVWFRPATMKFNKSAVGLTGAGGTLHSRVLPNPIGAGAIVATRLFLFRMPDPEIEFPAGTELLLRITAAPHTAETESRTRVDEKAIAQLQQIPAEITLPDKHKASDIINLAFAGTQAAVLQAFEASGWTTADTLSPRTAARTYKAFASMNTYAKAPVSQLFYEGRVPDLVFQKSFNSLAKRHHIRLWQTEMDGQPLWLGAATHDVAIAIDWNRVSLTHRIDPLIDRERRKIINDLQQSGCLTGVVNVPRPSHARDATHGAAVTTDGGLTLATLQPCESISDPVHPLLKPRKRLPAVFIRRLVLETRQYITRGNAYYWAYRTVKRGLFPKQATPPAGNN